MINFVTVDWDYFFPDVLPFDWGHQENSIFIEKLWPYRAGCRNLFTGEYAVDAVRPRPEYKTFWDNFGPFEPAALVVTESHAEAFDFIYGVGLTNLHIINFDAHHDIHYTSGIERGPDCGSWVGHAMDKGLVKEYTLYYPAWRKTKPEGRIPDMGVPVNVKYGLPRETLEPLVLFICRSGAWTPSWADAAWLDFIDRLKQKYPMKQGKSYIFDYVLKEREPGLEDALAIKKQWMEKVENYNVPLLKPNS